MIFKGMFYKSKYSILAKKYEQSKSIPSTQLH